MAYNSTRKKKVTFAEELNSISVNEQLSNKMNSLTDQIELSAIAQSDENIDQFKIITKDEAITSDRKILREFAAGENLAHNLAYKKFEKGAVVQIQEADQTVASYQVMELETGQGGVVGHVFIPLKSDNSRVHVAFKGTKDLATLHADLEHNAGEEAIYKRGNMDRILAQINEVIGYVNHRSGKQVDLTMGGHSLGGALAGQCIAAALGHRATNMLVDPNTTEEERQFINEQNAKLSNYFESTYGIKLENTSISLEERENFNKVASFNLLTWNKTGESKQVADYSNAMANLIVAKQGRNAVKARFGMVAGDGVQQTGEATVLSECEGDVAVMKVDIGLEGHAHRNFVRGIVGTGALAALGGVALGPIGAIAAGTAMGMLYTGATVNNAVAAHTAHHFDNKNTEALAKLRYEVNTNDSSEGKIKIKKRLQKKSTMLQNGVMLAGKKALHRTGQLFGNNTHRKAVTSNKQANNKMTPTVRAM